MDVYFVIYWIICVGNAFTYVTQKKGYNVCMENGLNQEYIPEKKNGTKTGKMCENIQHFY